MKTKKCSKCGIEQPLDDYHFRRRKNVGDGFRATCRICDGHKYIPPKPKAKDGYFICNCCGRELPLTPKYFIINKNYSKTGFQTKCRECKGINFKEDKPVAKEGYKFCSVCGKEYPETTEYFNIKRKNKLNARCVFCSRKYGNEYTKNNKEKRYMQGKKYYENNKEHILNRISKYRKTKIGKAKRSILFWNRRNRLKNTISCFSLEDWKECLKFFNYKDAYTGIPMKIISQDHIIPVSKGGSYTKQNIVPCEKRINSSKSNTDMEQWYKLQPFYSEERLNKIHEWMGIKDNKQQLSIL